jgi:hypothetical protein
VSELDSPGPAPVATGVDDVRLAGLRRWNLALTVLHAAQAIAVLLLASSDRPVAQLRLRRAGYLVLSLVAKSLLAWQVFAGSLAP